MDLSGLNQKFRVHWRAISLDNPHVTSSSNTKVYVLMGNGACSANWQKSCSEHHIHTHKNTPHTWRTNARTHAHSHKYQAIRTIEGCHRGAFWSRWHQPSSEELPVRRDSSTREGLPSFDLKVEQWSSTLFDLIPRHYSITIYIAIIWPFWAGMLRSESPFLLFVSPYSRSRSDRVHP